MHRGFSTLELLIAMTVLISAFTATILLTSGQTLTVDAQVAAEALTVAREALENQQALARKDFKLVVPASGASGITGVEATTTIDVVQTEPFVKQVKATVSWKGTFGRTHEVTLSALVTDFNSAVGGDTCSSVLTGDWKNPVVTNGTFATIVGDSNANGAYPLTGIDAYQKRLYVAVATSSAPLGPQSPNSADIIDDGSFGTLVWSNPDRAASSNNSYATRTMSGTNSTHYLQATNFGFAIPPGSTIVGIQVEIEKLRNSGSSGEVRDSRMRIVKNGVIGATDRALGGNWPTSEAYVSHGGATDLWSEMWTPADINSANFGVALSARGSSSGTNRVANVDHVRVSVYYTKQFYVLDIANPASPTFLGGLATTSQGIVGYNAVAVATTSSAHYAYVATNSSTGLNQLQVINVSNPAAPFITSSYPGVAGSGMGQGTGNSIFYKDGYAYVGLTPGAAGSEFNIIDVSTPGSPQWKGGWTDPSGATAINTIYVKDGYAYLTTNDLSRELVVLNVTNPASPTFVSSYDATPDSANFGYGRAFYKVGDTAYLGRSWTNSPTTPQYLSLDASTTPLSLFNVKSLGTNLSLRGIIVRDYLAFLLTGSQTSGGNLQIMSATSTAAWGAGTVALPPGSSGQGGTALDCEGNYVYAASVDSTNRGYLTAVTGN